MTITHPNPLKLTINLVCLHSSNISKKLFALLYACFTVCQFAGVANGKSIALKEIDAL